MDAQSYGIQWIRHTAADMKTARELIISEQPPEDEHDLINNDNAGQHHHSDYLVDQVSTEEDIDQIAAENLIFMAHDGQMVAEFISATGGANRTVVVAASDGTPIDCALLRQSRREDCSGGMEEQGIQTNGSDLMAFNEEYGETQMVTEEVITDDWVQPQGEERVEIPAEQIICSNSLAPLDNEVPLPTVQDEYTALRPYPCDFCSRRFRKKTSLMNHMVAHQNDRPHLCKLCGSRFFRRSDLINHLKAHAEMPDPEFDDVEFMTFVQHETIEQQQKQSNDNFYDQDWNRQANPSRMAMKSTRKTHSAIVSENSSSSYTQRGRISRIKPKEENNYTIDETLHGSHRSGGAVHSAQLERYEDCPGLQTSTAVANLVQDNADAHVSGDKEQFPVLDESKPFVCQQCGLAFAREKALMSHVKNHRTDSPHECSHCNEMFWDSSSLQDHLKSHQFEDSNSEYEPAEADEVQSDSESEYLYGEFYCHVCGMSFHRQDLLNRHAKQHVKHEEDLKDRHCCNTCGETFAEALDLLAHAEIHARYPPFKCVLCGESFFEEATIKRHLNSMHSNEMTVNSCILCGKECRDRKALMKHAWDHSREKCHSCSKCGKNFHNKARLKRHMTSHRDKSVVCDVCQAEFPDGRTLSNHRHSHSATASGKLFPCNECGKTFGSRSSQQIHVRIHTGERPYGCRYCWKAFADGGTLRKHERIHTGEKPYACSVCPRAFNQRVVLREHIRSHHSALDNKRGTYFCKVCSAELATSGDLIQHLIQHSDKNTAIQRQPITGPRKYKRRRKLKPHEIAQLRNENSTNGKDELGAAGSDIDISDFDIENVDDLLGITETGSGSSSANIRKHNKRNTSADEHGTVASTTLGQEQLVSPPTDAEGVLTNYEKEHYSSSGNSGSKLNSWQTKLITSNSNDESYKSLLSNLENTLQSIDTLVVGVSNTGKLNENRVQQNTKATPLTGCLIKEQLTLVRTQPAVSTAARVRSANKRMAQRNETSSRPRMIHTERTRLRTARHPEGAKRRTKTPSEQIEARKTQLPASRQTNGTNSNNLVNGYEIALPEMHQSSQHDIPSSPMTGIKEEFIVYQKNDPENNTKHNDSNSQRNRNSDLYDAQLLLEATTLRKDVYEKYNPDLVSDLEEILRSPDKSSDKIRQRFTSESSSTANYLVEPTEGEQHLIKIEPTSPDIHDIVAGSSVVVGNINSHSSERQLAKRSMRRRPVTNRRYLEFETELTNLSSSRSSERNTLHHEHKSSASKFSKPHLTECSKNYLSYATPDYRTANGEESDGASCPTGGNGKNASTSFSSISAVVAAAAAAADDAAKTSNSSPSKNSTANRNRRYYECEMCSAVFPDRAQLLDHVPIHI